MHIYETDFHEPFYYYYFLLFIYIFPAPVCSQQKGGQNNGRVLSTHIKVVHSSWPPHPSTPPWIKASKVGATLKYFTQSRRGVFPSRWFTLMEERALWGEESAAHWKRLLCVLCSPPIKNDGLLLWRRPGRDVSRVRRQGFRVSLRTPDLRKLQGWWPSSYIKRVYIVWISALKKRLKFLSSYFDSSFKSSWQ